MTFTVITAVDTSNVAAALDVVGEKANNPEQLKLHPKATQVVIQRVAQAPQPKDYRQHHQWRDKFIELARHNRQRRPRCVVFCLRVVNKYSRQVKKTGKPCHDKDDMKTLNPKHSLLHAGFKLNSK